MFLFTLHVTDLVPKLLGILNSVFTSHITNTTIWILNFPQMVTRTKKIFVGGVSASTTEDDLTNYFKTFGSVSTL